MPIPIPVSPKVFKQMLERYGYSVIKEEAKNWHFAKGENDLPILLPKIGEVVLLDALSNILHKTKMDDATYFSLLKEVEQES